MFEVKCDVKGCGERAPLMDGVGAALPPGWRLEQFDQPVARAKAPKDASDVMMKFAKRLNIPPEFGEYLKELSQTMAPATVVLPSFGRRLLKHVCHKHPMLEFDDGIGDEWDELGELAPGMTHEQLGDLVDPVAASTSRDGWTIPLPSLEGKAGERKTSEIVAGCLFAGNRLIATDTSATAGLGTVIVGIRIGGKPQRPGGGVGAGGTLTMFFGPDAKGNSLQWDPCQPEEKIEIDVDFLSDCRWDATVEGQAVLST